MYYLLFATLLICCTFNLSNNTKLYRVLWLVLTIVLVLRYGQGTDYISYNYHYQSIGKMSDIKNVTYYGLDYGYMLINKLFGLTGLSFQWFIAIVSLFMMICLDRFVKKYSNKPVLTLLLFYPTYYLTYYMSAIAQGIVIAFFIGFMLDWLLNRKIIPYICLCIIASTIHYSGLILFAGLFVYLIKEKTIRYLIFVSILLCGIGFILGQRVSFVSRYYESPHLVSVAEKTLWLVVLICLSIKVKMDDIDVMLLKLYYIGFAVSMTFLFFPTASSRLGAYFKILETVLFTRLLFKYKKEDIMPQIKKYVIKVTYASVIVLAITTAMFYKNINQFLVNGKYYDTSFFSYRYITIFQKDDLYQYRDSVFRGLID